MCTCLWHISSHYHDNSISFQYPEATIPTVTCIDTPMVHYPNRAIISDSLPPVESDPPQELKRQAFQDVKVDTKRKQKETSLNPMDNMFNFLRCTTIDENASLTSLNTGKLNNFLQKRWLVEKQIPIVPFKYMKDTFKKATCPLTYRHYRLLIEDLFLLAPGDKIVCLIFMKQKWL